MIVHQQIDSLIKLINFYTTGSASKLNSTDLSSLTHHCSHLQNVILLQQKTALLSTVLLYISCRAPLVCHYTFALSQPKLEILPNMDNCYYWKRVVKKGNVKQDSVAGGNQRSSMIINRKRSQLVNCREYHQILAYFSFWSLILQTTSLTN